MTHIDTMKQAREYTRPGALVPIDMPTIKLLLDALRLAIEQAENQEPVAWRAEASYWTHFDSIPKEWRKYAKPLYDAPPQRSGPSGDCLGDFREDQWWFEELLAATQNGTSDQKRAVAVVRNLLATVAANIVPRQRQPLTDEQIEDDWERITEHSIFGGDRSDGRTMYISPDEVIEFARAIEAAHGITGESK